MSVTSGVDAGHHASQRTVFIDMSPGVDGIRIDRDGNVVGGRRRRRGLRRRPLLQRTATCWPDSPAGDVRQPLLGGARRTACSSLPGDLCTASTSKPRDPALTAIGTTFGKYDIRTIIARDTAGRTLEDGRWLKRDVTRHVAGPGPGHDPAEVREALTSSRDQVVFGVVDGWPSFQRGHVVPKSQPVLTPSGRPVRTGDS